jgi:2'-5' RNA ligase
MAITSHDPPMAPFADSHTVPNVRGDFAEWHRGRTPYVFWALDVDCPEVGQIVAQAAGLLDGLLLEGYCRQPHITLELCGFPADKANDADEFSLAWLEGRCAALRRADLRPFSLTVGGWSSFASAPYLKVADPGRGIAALRRCLAVDGVHRLFGDYLPHVTIGLYADAWPVERVLKRLTGFTDASPCTCRIDRVSLMAYQPEHIGGPLARLGHFSLDRQEMAWQTDWPFAAAF